jgi:hypothetical protein
MAGHQRGQKEQRHAERNRDRHRLPDGAGEHAAPHARIVEGERSSGQDREQSTEHASDSL